MNKTEVVTVPAVAKNFEMVDMNVSKKELIQNLVEVHKANMQRSIEETQEELCALNDFSDLLPKPVQAKIAAEVKANKTVKNFLDSKTKLMSISSNVNSGKTAVKVEANYRNQDVNVAVVLQEKHTTLYFGTSVARAQTGTVDLNKVSATAKKVHSDMNKRLAKIKSKETQLNKQQKEFHEFSRNASKVKLDFDKKILAQSAEGRKMLVELARLEKDFKKIR